MDKVQITFDRLEELTKKSPAISGKAGRSKSDALKRGKASTNGSINYVVLKIDVGATHVKIVGRGRKELREVESDPTLILKL